MTVDRARTNGALGPESAFWRRMAYAGARHGPELWLKWSPPLFGVAFALALGSARRQVRDNLRRALGKRSLVEEQLDVARTFVSYAGCLAEALGSERPEVLRARRRIRDGQLRALLAAEGGLIIGTAHFGAWDAAAPLLAKDFGRPVIVAMQAEADSEARALHDAVRARAGVRVVHVGGHPLDALPLLHHLQDGGIVAVQLDRVPRGGRAVSVPFLGRELAMPEGPFALAAIAQVPLVPLFVRRAGYLDYELGAGMPIRLPERATPAELREAAARAAGEMERSVRACPTQWFEFG